MSSVDATELLNFERKLAGLSREKLDLEQRVQELTAELHSLRPVVGSSGTPVNHLVEQAQRARANYEAALGSLATAVMDAQIALENVNRASESLQVALNNIAADLECPWLHGATVDQSMSLPLYSLERSVEDFTHAWKVRVAFKEATAQLDENAAQAVSAD